MWQPLVKKWVVAVCVIALVSCFLGAVHMCSSGSCLSPLDHGAAFFQDGAYLHQWVKQDKNFTAEQLRGMCQRIIDDSAQDYVTAKQIEELANNGPTLNEFVEGDESQTEAFKPLMEALDALEPATTRLRIFLNSSNYTGYRPLEMSHRLGEMMNGPKRGIVMAAGGLVPLTNAYTTIHVLRHVHKSKLPVQIFYNGKHEFSPEMQDAFVKDFTGVSCHDLAEMAIPSHLQPPANPGNLFRQEIGFTLKAKMLLFTHFEEVLVLDSDSIPLRDPDELFMDPHFITNGSMFWPDFWAKDRHCPGPVYKRLNLTDPWEANPSELTVESGQFLINRKMHFDAIQYMVLLNMYGQHTYKLMSGDKDTYRLSFSLAHKAHRFIQIKAPPANAMRGPADWTRPLNCDEVFPDSPDLNPLPQLNAPSPEKLQEELDASDSYKHAGMIQMTSDGRMAFLHHTADSKWDPRHKFAFFGKPVTYVTFPLSTEQARRVFLDGFMFTHKFTIKNTTDCPPRPGLELLETLDRCQLRNEPEDQDTIPMVPAQLFAEFLHAVEEAFRVFKDWQVSFMKNTNPLSFMHDSPSATS